MPANKLEKFQTVIIERSQLKNSPYNPRFITDKARGKLRELIKKFGIVTTPVWNKRSGHIVGGHQRVAIMDTIMGTKDYKITVSQVDYDSKAEKELNVALNNPGTQGEYDMEKLFAMVQDEEFDYKAAGFDETEISQMFGIDAVVKNVDADKVEEMAAKVRAANELMDQIVADSESRFDVDLPLFYFRAIFKSPQDRCDFLNALNISNSQPYVDGAVLKKLLLDRSPEALQELTDATAKNSIIGWLLTRTMKMDHETAKQEVENQISQIMAAVLADLPKKKKQPAEESSDDEAPQPAPEPIKKPKKTARKKTAKSS